MASKLLLILVFVLDLIAFALAVAAEQRRSTGTSRKDTEDTYQYCVYDSDIATGYGVGAFLFLLASQIIIMVASKCFCCGSPLRPGGSRACAVLLFIICWVTFFIAEVCLLAGSVRNAYHTKYTTKFFDNPPSCQTVRKGVFAAGAVFVLFTGIISEFYYVSYSKARGSFTPYGGETGVGMAAYKITFFIAEVCLLAGSVRNAYHTKYTTKFFDNPPSCQTVRKGVFAAGAVFVLFTGTISEFYYVSYSKARGSFTPYGGETGVGMAAYK